MSDVLRIPGVSMLALEAIADNAGIDVPTFIGQSIGLGLNLADISLDAECAAGVLFEVADGDYREYKLDFGPVIKPVLLDEMISFECGLDYRPPYDLHLPPLITETIDATTVRFQTQRTDFIETAVFFRNMWALTRKRHGEILIDYTGKGDDHLVVEKDERIFKYEIAS